MRTLVLAFLLVLGVGLARADSGAISYQGGDGSTMDKAIVIVGAADDLSATKAEYAYLSQHFPGYQMQMQSLLSQKKRSYDLLDFRESAGKSRKIYFDITSTLGKY